MFKKKFQHKEWQQCKENFLYDGKVYYSKDFLHSGLFYFVKWKCYLSPSISYQWCNEWFSSCVGRGYNKIKWFYQLGWWYILSVCSWGKQLVLFSQESWCSARQSWGKTKLVRVNFPKGPSIKCFVIYLDFPLNNHRAKTNKQTNKQRNWSHAVVFGTQATTAQLYTSRDTFEFDQGHVTKNQPITVFIL